MAASQSAFCDDGHKFLCLSVLTASSVNNKRVVVIALDLSHAVFLLGSQLC